MPFSKSMTARFNRCSYGTRQAIRLPSGENVSEAMVGDWKKVATGSSGTGAAGGAGSAAKSGSEATKKSGRRFIRGCEGLEGRKKARPKKGRASITNSVALARLEFLAHPGEEEPAEHGRTVRRSVEAGAAKAPVGRRGDVEQIVRPDGDRAVPKP